MQESQPSLASRPTSVAVVAFTLLGLHRVQSFAPALLVKEAVSTRAYCNPQRQLQLSSPNHRSTRLQAVRTAPRRTRQRQHKAEQEHDAGRPEATPLDIFRLEAIHKLKAAWLLNKPQASLQQWQSAPRPALVPNPEAEAVGLTERINHVTSLLQKASNDTEVRRGLVRLVARRRAMLNTLYEQDVDKCLNLVQRLGLRFRPPTPAPGVQPKAKAIPTSKQSQVLAQNATVARGKGHRRKTN